VYKHTRHLVHLTLRVHLLDYPVPTVGPRYDYLAGFIALKSKDTGMKSWPKNKILKVLNACRKQSSSGTLAKATVENVRIFC